jgi:hypothetical protein
VLISTDCGTTWSSIYYKGGVNLKTKNPQQTAFVPTSSQWRLETVSLAPYASATQAIIRFRNINGYGNNLYIDDINITAATGIYSAMENPDIEILPNPGNGIFNIRFPASISANIFLSVINSLGKTVYTKSLSKNSGDDISLNISFLSPGVYFLKFNDEGFSSVKKIVIEK